jgi:hypothetical protein
VATTVYADASGNDHSEPLCLIAGWWNTVDNWTKFAEEWKAFLKQRGISYLHQTGNYEWKRDPVNRASVLNEAMRIITKSGAFSHCFFTPTSDWHKYSAEVKTTHDLDSPDCFSWNAFRFVLHVQNWCERQHFRMPEFVFESSTKKEEDALREVMERYRLPEPIFRKKLEEDPIRSVVALQASDFLAYEIFRGWKDIVNKHSTSREYLQAFERARHSWGWADKEKMDGLIPISDAQHRLERIVNEREMK